MLRPGNGMPLPSNGCESGPSVSTLTIHDVETILCSKIKIPFGHRPFIGLFGQLVSTRMFRSGFCKRPGRQPISSCQPLTGICLPSRR
jgi:hypothetical protein